MRRIAVLAGAVVLVVVVLASVVLPAGAKVSGSNGLIAFVRSAVNGDATTS